MGLSTDVIGVVCIEDSDGSDVMGDVEYNFIYFNGQSQEIFFGPWFFFINQFYLGH
jgi:hypothetical protein